MNGPDYTNRPQPWSWFIQDDPAPELSDWDKRDNRTDGDNK